MKGLEFKIVRTQDELERIYKIIYESLLYEGLIEPNENKLLHKNSYFDQFETTYPILATLENKPVATLTFILDSENGLPEDIDFPEELSQLRKSNSLSSLGRLYCVPEIRNNSIVVRSLTQESWFLQDVFGSNLFVSSINPKNEKYYEKLIDMKRIAYTEKIKDKNLNVPAVLMGRNHEQGPIKVAPNNKSLITNLF